MERDFYDKRYNTHAIIYCENIDIDVVGNIKKMYIEKGYNVLQAGTMIKTGTHGDVHCEELDIMTEFTEEEYEISDAEDKKFMEEMDKLYDERFLTKPIEGAIKIDRPANDEYYKLAEESNEFLRDKMIHKYNEDINIILK